MEVDHEYDYNHTLVLHDTGYVNYRGSSKAGVLRVVGAVKFC